MGSISGVVAIVLDVIAVVFLVTEITESARGTCRSGFRRARHQSIRSASDGLRLSARCWRRRERDRSRAAPDTASERHLLPVFDNMISARVAVTAHTHEAAPGSQAAEGDEADADGKPDQRNDPPEAEEEWSAHTDLPFLIV